MNPSNDFPRFTPVERRVGEAINVAMWAAIVFASLCLGVWLLQQHGW